MPKNKELSAEEEFNALPEATPTGLPSINEPTGVQLPDSVKAGAKLVTTPQRGMRGVGVMAEKILSKTNPIAFTPGGTLTPDELSQMLQSVPDALERGAAAVEPGYVPQEGERLGAAAGEIVGSMPLATLTGGAGEAPEAYFTTKTLIQALRNFGAGATLSAIDQASEKGNIDLYDVAKIGSTGAILPLIRPTGQFLGRIVKALSRETTAATTTMSKEAAETLMENPNLLKEAAGTAETVNNRVVTIQKALQERIDDVGRDLNKAREPFGINANIDDEIQERIAKEGFSKRTEQDVMKDALDNVAGIKRSVGTDRLAADTTEIPYKDRVRGLYKSRQELDQFINWRKNRPDLPPITEAEERPFRNIRNQINSLLDTFGKKDPTVRKLRATDEAYSLTRDLYDRLQRSLVDEDKAEQVLMKIAKGDNLEETIGLTGGLVNRLQQLEKETGKKLIEPLRKEFLAHNIKGMKAKSGVTTGLLGVPVGATAEGLGPEGTANVLRAVGQSGRLMDQLINAASRPMIGLPLVEQFRKE